MASSSGATAAAAEDEGADAKDDPAGGPGGDLTNSGSVENLTTLNSTTHAQQLNQPAATVPVNRYHKTALHVHSGFIDVGDDAAFFSSENSQYIEQLAREMLLKAEREESDQSVNGQSTTVDSATSDAMNLMEEM